MVGTGEKHNIHSHKHLKIEAVFSKDTVNERERVKPAATHRHGIRLQMAESGHEDEHANLLGDEGLRAAGQVLKLGYLFQLQLSFSYFFFCFTNFFLECFQISQKKIVSKMRRSLKNSFLTIFFDIVTRRIYALSMYDKIYCFFLSKFKHEFRYCLLECILSVKGGFSLVSLYLNLFLVFQHVVVKISR